MFLVKQGIGTVIGAGTAVTGIASLKGSIRIDGTVNSNVRCEETVVLGEDGRIDGSVFAKKVLAAGEITGNIEADKVVLETSARVGGEVLAAEITDRRK